MQVCRPHGCAPHSHPLDAVNVCRRSFDAKSCCVMRPAALCCEMRLRRRHNGATALQTSGTGGNMGGAERYGASDGAAWSLRRPQPTARTACRTGARRGQMLPKNLYCTNRKISASAFGSCKHFENRVTRRLLKSFQSYLGLTRPAPIHSRKNSRPGKAK